MSIFRRLHRHDIILRIIPIILHKLYLYTRYVTSAIHPSTDYTPKGTSRPPNTARPNTFTHTFTFKVAGYLIIHTCSTFHQAPKHGLQTTARPDVNPRCILAFSFPGLLFSWRDPDCHFVRLLTYALYLGHMTLFCTADIPQLLINILSISVSLGSSVESLYIQTPQLNSTDLI